MHRRGSAGRLRHRSRRALKLAILLPRCARPMLWLHRFAPHWRHAGSRTAQRMPSCDLSARKPRPARRSRAKFSQAASSRPIRSASIFGFLYRLLDAFRVCGPHALDWRRRRHERCFYRQWRAARGLTHLPRRTHFAGIIAERPRIHGPRLSGNTRRRLRFSIRVRLDITTPGKLAVAARAIQYLQLNSSFHHRPFLSRHSAIDVVDGSPPTAVMIAG